MMVAMVVAVWCLLGVLFIRMEESKSKPIRWAGKVLGWLLVAVVVAPFILTIAGASLAGICLALGIGK